MHALQGLSIAEVLAIAKQSGIKRIAFATQTP